MNALCEEIRGNKLKFRVNYTADRGLGTPTLKRYREITKWQNRPLLFPYKQKVLRALRSAVINCGKSIIKFSIV